MSRLAKWFAVVALLLLLALPVRGASAAIGGPYTVGVQIANLSASTANIVMQFYDQAGTLAASSSDSITANSSKTYFPLSAVSSGFNGSMVVSADQQVVAIGNIIFPDGSGQAAYGSFSAGATTVNLPLMMRGNFNIDTWFNVQNTSGTAATVNVAYTGGCSDSQSVPAYASKTFDQSATGCLSDGYVGAATLTSAQPIVAVVMQIQRPAGAFPKQLLAYGGFTSSSTNPVMPLISSNFFNSGTGTQIQNTGGSATSVTLTYSPSFGFPGASCTETKSIPANSSVTFGFPQLPAGCGTGGSGVTDAVNGGFVGSAKVTTNSTSQNLVAIVNQVSRVSATADAYDAVNPASATNKVAFPLIMDRNFGLFTGFAVANVGASTTTVNCTFSGTPYTVSASVPAGQSLTDVQLNKISAGYVGSAVCTATGGDQKIAGIVNEALQGAPAANDGLAVYSGFNY